MVKLANATKEYGGKAFGLSALISAKINVPEGVAFSNNEVKNILAGNSIVLNEIVEFLKLFPEKTLFAVRSSASSEDGESQSYAGMFSTKLNVANNLECVINAIKEVYYSAKGTRVKEYSNNSSQEMNVIIQRMITPKIAGVAFTKAIDTNGDDVILIEAVNGEGEALVSGIKTASRIIVPKNQMISKEQSVKFYGTPIDISDIDKLIQGIKKINDYFKKEMDIEWCIDENREIYFLQARPITKIPVLDEMTSEGIIASRGEAKGIVYIIDENTSEENIQNRISNFPQDAVLVATYTDVDYVPAMKKAKGIIVEDGSALSHSAIVARELGIPCIEGIKDAKKIFKEGEEIFLDANNGIIEQGDIKIFLASQRSFEFKDVFDYENIDIVNFNDTKILLKSSPDGLIAYLPIESSSDNIEKINIFLRKAFKSSPILSCSDMYLWYFEYERCKNFKFFTKLLSKAKTVTSNLDGKALGKLYEDSLKIVKKFVDEKKNASNYDKVVIDELCMAFHFSLDMLIPNGIVIKTLYFDILPTLEKYNLQFKDLLSNDFDSEVFKLEDINKIKKSRDFLQIAKNLRNTVYEKFVKLGAMKRTFFDERGLKMENALKEIGVDFLSDGNLIEDVFYNNLKFSSGVKKLIEFGEEML